MCKEIMTRNFGSKMMKLINSNRIYKNVKFNFNKTHYFGNDRYKSWLDLVT